MSEFDSLETTADWSDKLAEMLDEAGAATKAKDDDERLSIAARLRAFVKSSPPLLPGATKLDGIALDAATKLAESVIDDAIERIKGRTAEFTALKKQIEVVSLQAERSARLVRLEPARAAVASLTGAVHAIEDLNLVLVQGPDDDLKKKIKAILKALESAKDVLEEATKPTG